MPCFDYAPSIFVLPATEGMVEFESQTAISMYGMESRALRVLHNWDEGISYSHPDDQPYLCNLIVFLVAVILFASRVEDPDCITPFVNELSLILANNAGHAWNQE